jgi:hypothetical protein
MRLMLRSASLNNVIHPAPRVMRAPRLSRDSESGDGVMLISVAGHNSYTRFAATNQVWLDGVDVDIDYRVAVTG